ncbi:TonB-dependent receptor [Xanthomonas citri pv. citri]|nr:TonB-dependent receptor [Xanthomonas citri pv. citri]MBD4168872.1 TonB-dependent receptor [Xanthomonas citri pv. citri]
MRAPSSTAWPTKRLISQEEMWGNLRSKYFTQIGRLDSKVFTDEYKQLDLTASYQINDWMGISFSATNLLDSTYYWYNEVKYAPIGMYKNGRGYQAQLNFKF